MSYSSFGIHRQITDHTAVLFVHQSGQRKNERKTEVNTILSFRLYCEIVRSGTAVLLLIYSIPFY